VEVLEEAGVLGVLGVLDELDVPEEFELLLELAAAELEPAESPVLAPAESDLGAASPPALLLEYRSLYQPPPLRWNAAAVICFASDPPQASHDSRGGSLTFWRCSSWAPHCVQR
jgi:hypothetical protein